MPAMQSNQPRDTRDTTEIKSLIRDIKQAGYCSDVIADDKSSGLYAAVWRHQEFVGGNEAVEIYLCFRNGSGEMCATFIDSTLGTHPRVTPSVRTEDGFAVVNVYTLYSAVFGNDKEESWKVRIFDMWTAPPGLAPLEALKLAREDSGAYALLNC